MPIIRLGGPQKFSHLKYWASELPMLRTTNLKSSLDCKKYRIRLETFNRLFSLKIQPGCNL